MEIPARKLRANRPGIGTEHAPNTVAEPSSAESQSEAPEQKGWPRRTGSNMALCERRSCWILSCQYCAIGRIYEAMDRSRHTLERVSKGQSDAGRAEVRVGRALTLDKS